MSGGISSHFSGKDSGQRTIKKSGGLSRIDWLEIWQYRELLYFLTWRDLKIRYRQTLIGVLWALLQPLLAMLLFTAVFGKFAKIPSENIPYPIFAYSGLLLWNFFSNAAVNSSNSLISNSNLITKIYFPRLIIPFSSTVAGIVDYLVAMSLLILLMVSYGRMPNGNLFFLPVVLALAFLTANGLGLWLSALNVKYRDVRYAIPFVIQLLFFATPIVYPSGIFPEKYRWLLSLNPIAGLMDAHRACLLGSKALDWHLFIGSGLIGLLLFLTGAIYFQKTERFFADII
jgi:lipopolysaccharide transport system permease protein